MWKALHSYRPLRWYSTQGKSLFETIDQVQKKWAASGQPVTNASIGEPPFATPALIRDKIRVLSDTLGLHRYPASQGMESLRSAAIDWQTKRFNLDAPFPLSQCLVTNGSKEALSALVQALVGPGEILGVPDASYPIPRNAALARGGEVFDVPRDAKGELLFEEIPDEVVGRMKLLYLNYPANPTGQVASKDFYQRVTDWAARHEIKLLSDLAYAETYFVGEAKPRSIFQDNPKARSLAVEAYSASKQFSAASLRVGWVVGAKDLIGKIQAHKSYSSDGTCELLQLSVAEALRQGVKEQEQWRQVLTERRGYVAHRLSQLGLESSWPRGGMFFWIKAPSPLTGEALFQKLADRQCLVMPGGAFGPKGKDYIRVSLGADQKDLERVLAALEVVIKPFSIAV